MLLTYTQLEPYVGGIRRAYIENEISRDPSSSFEWSRVGEEFRGPFPRCQGSPSDVALVGTELGKRKIGFPLPHWLQFAVWLGRAYFFIRGCAAGVPALNNRVRMSSQAPVILFLQKFGCTHPL